MNEEQLRAMLKQAAGKLGMSENKLMQNAQNGKLAQSLGSTHNEALKKALSDPEEAKRLLSTPQAQKLMQMLSGKKKP